MRLALLASVAGAALSMAATLAWAQQRPAWKALDQDGNHDPASPAIEVLQQPAAALEGMPADTVGNRVRWVDALRDGQIAPRTNILPGTEVRVLWGAEVLRNRLGVAVEP